MDSIIHTVHNFRYICVVCAVLFQYSILSQSTYTLQVSETLSCSNYDFIDCVFKKCSLVDISKIVDNDKEEKENEKDVKHLLKDIIIRHKYEFDYMEFYKNGSIKNCDFDVYKQLAIEIIEYFKSKNIELIKDIEKVVNKMTNKSNQVTSETKIIEIKTYPQEPQVITFEAAENIVNKTIETEDILNESSSSNNLTEENSQKMIESTDVIKPTNESDSNLQSNITSTKPKSDKIQKANTVQNKTEQKCPGKKYSDCYDHFKLGYTKNTVLNIRPVDYKDCRTWKVYCDMKQGGWTVIMRRMNGLIDFNRNWTEYKNGFGDTSNEYWLGNDLIHYLTLQGNYSLKIEMENWNDVKKFALYESFYVSSEYNGYKLYVNSYSGNAGDSLSIHNGYKFSTFDVDNDEASVDLWGGNCAARFKGGWWYNACYRANLNGLYYNEGNITEKKNDGISWNTWLGHKYSLKFVEMKIKKNFKK